MHPVLDLDIPKSWLVKDSDIRGANFPMDEEGRTYHLRTKAGEVANDILLVGDPDRAELIANTSLDQTQPYFKKVSNRGFVTYTGMIDGWRVSIVSIGMGWAMMDFAVRELRAIIPGPMRIIRLGSCGTPQKDIPVSTVVVAKESFAVRTNHDAFTAAHRAFTLEDSVFPDKWLHDDLVRRLKIVAKGQFSVVEKTDATADTFYDAQGWIDRQLQDVNANLIEEVLKKYPDTGSLQMETSELFRLAKLNEMARNTRDISVAACAIVLANRCSNDFLPHAEKHKVEIAAGRACLQSLIDATRPLLYFSPV